MRAGTRYSWLDVCLRTRSCMTLAAAMMGFRLIPTRVRYFLSSAFLAFGPCTAPSWNTRVPLTTRGWSLYPQADLWSAIKAADMDQSRLWLTTLPTLGTLVDATTRHVPRAAAAPPARTRPVARSPRPRCGSLRRGHPQRARPLAGLACRHALPRHIHGLVHPGVEEWLLRT